jgi:cold shock CspA family protein
VRGRVKAWDDPGGFGTIEASDGRSFFFHCTQIADQTRTIEVGTAVRFDIVAGHCGRWEAARVEKQ